MIAASSSIAFLTMGAFLGLTAGLSPGPLLTLVITETLKHSRAAGIKIAVAPLITDVPIIIFTYFIFSKLSQFHILLSLISLLGGIFFAYLGYETLTTKELVIGVQSFKSQSFKKGITANILNPNPYIFWLTAGVPTAFKAYEISLLTAILYFLFFYVTLIGSKIIIAFLVDKSKIFLKNKAYRITMQVLAGILFIFALLFLYDGIKTLRYAIK